MNANNRHLAATATLMLALAVAGAGPAVAQERLTLAEAVAEALEKSDLLRIEDARVAAANGSVEAARGNFWPTVTFEERFTATDNPAYDFSIKLNQGGFTAADLMGAPDSFNDPDPISDFQTSLTVTQPIYSRRIGLGVEMARAEAEAADLDRERSREGVVHRVQQAWLGARAAEAYLETAVLAERDADEHLRLATVAEEAGTGLASDRLRAEVARAEARRMRLAVENDLEIARRGLGLAIGREEEVAPAETASSSAASDLETLLSGAGGRADLLALEARAANARRAAKLEGASRLPEVGLVGSLQANDPDYPFGTSGTSYLVGVGVTWRIFDGQRSKASEARAEAEALQAESALTAAVKEVRFRIREAWLRWREAQAGITIAESALAAAEEGVRLVRVRYENGLSTMVALLDAQSALNRARSDVVRARAGEVSALGELEYRAGVLLGKDETTRRDRTGGVVPHLAASARR